MASGTSAQTPEPRFRVFNALRSRPRSRVHLRTVLITVNLVILAMLILAFWTARFYESELLRQAEVELLTEAAFVRAAYLEALETLNIDDPETYSHASANHPPLPKLWRLNETVDVHRIQTLEMAAAPEAGDAMSPDVAQAGKRTQRLIDAAWKGLLTQESATQLRGGAFDVVEHRGLVVASSHWPLSGSLAHRPEVDAALGGQSARVARRCIQSAETERSGMCVTIAVPIVRDGRIWGAVVVSKAPLGVLYALSLHRRVIVVWLIVMVIAMVLQTWYTSRLIVTPLHALVAQSERLARGDREALQVITGPITLEVEKLSVAVVHMASVLDERARYIRAFASNVSHEFKTPLSSIRGSVELLHDHNDTMDASDRQRFLAMIDRHAERLQRLVGRLLELARADTMEPNERTVAVPTALLALTERYRAEGLSIVLTLPQNRSMLLAMDTVTLETVIGNLVENARQHVGADVQIKVSAALIDDQISIVVEDDGSGISEANRAQIFKPFFTTARDEGGTGVGLAVVASMVHAHHGTIVLEPGLPTRFHLLFPVALS